MLTIHSEYFATSANTEYLLVSQDLVSVSKRADETTPRNTHASPRFITKPPPLSPVQGPVPFKSPAKKKKLKFKEFVTKNFLPAQNVMLILEIFDRNEDTPLDPPPAFQSVAPPQQTDCCFHPAPIRLVSLFSQQPMELRYFPTIDKLV